ncbi:heat shock 70kDa protein 1/2/6/8 [Myxococcaceae bacterium]|jgi:molecular chaperone DnaK|nr:heat shock 70kDa protein 1/2/6/8 [Myxococcaceae bacterium]
MAEIAIGIDLGTSNSCVAAVESDAPRVLPNAYGEGVTASVVAFGDDGRITVGNAARANVIHAPKTTVYSAKRLIGRYFFSEEVKKARAICSYDIVEGPNHGVRIRIRENDYSLPEISAMILRELKGIAEAQLGQAITKAVVTVPAYFNDNQRQATRDACRIAGLDALRILNEPTAAALAYGFGRELHQKVAVYDLGGGTFDISVLEIGKDVFEVLSTCGDTFLGGDDFDDRLIDLLADEFAAQHGVNPREDPFALEKLKVAAESAKKGLSVDDEVEIRIPDVALDSEGKGLSIGRTLGIGEYATLVNDLIQRTFKVCDEAMQQAGVVNRDLAGVILVGGPTRLPLIRHAVRDYFQLEPRTDVNPDEVVAMGAALHAASLLAPEQKAYLLDVTPLSLKIGVAGGLAETVIERNTPVPIDQTRTFTTFQDFQESVRIRVYQGESRHAAENELLGEFVFGGLARARRGETRIEVTFEINSDGIVHVTARDPATDQKASTQIKLSSGLSEEEIEQIIARGHAERVETALPGTDPSVRPGEAAAAFAARFGGPEDTPAADPPTAPESIGSLAGIGDEVEDVATLDEVAIAGSSEGEAVAAPDASLASLETGEIEVLPDELPDLEEILPLAPHEDPLSASHEPSASGRFEIELDPGDSAPIALDDRELFSAAGGDLGAEPESGEATPADPARKG